MTRLRSGLLFAAATLTLLSACQDASVPPTTIANWPPAVGQRLPDMTVLDHKGQPVTLASFEGRVLLIEPIGMGCRGCIGLCGGHERGPFQGTPPQQGLASIDDYFAQYADGADIDDPNLAVIQMLFFHQGQTPKLADAAQWARHFGIDERPNHYVVIGPEPLRQRTFRSIPGFWLVDKNLVVRCDAAGHHPPSNLYADLLPMVPELLRAEPSAPR